MAVRVYELAKELGLESKELLSTLKGMGEFVRSASSTIEAPVVRKVKEKLATESAPAAPAAAPAKAAPARTAPSGARPAAPAAKPSTPAPAASSRQAEIW